MLSLENAKTSANATQAAICLPRPVQAAICLPYTENQFQRPSLPLDLEDLTMSLKG